MIENKQTKKQTKPKHLCAPWRRNDNCVPGQTQGHMLPTELLLAQAAILATERQIHSLPMFFWEWPRISLLSPSLSVNPQELDFPGKLPVGAIIYNVEKNVPDLMWPRLHLWSKPDTAIPTKWKTANSRMTKTFFPKQFNLNKVKNLKKLGRGENPKEHTTWIHWFSHKETPSSKKIFKFNTNVIRRK